MITCPVIQTEASEEEDPEESCNFQAGTQVLRIVLYKCTLEGLRTIKAPSKLLRRYQAKVSILPEGQAAPLS